MFEPKCPHLLYVKISIRMDLKRVKCTVNASASASRARGAQSAYRHLTKIETTQKLGNLRLE